MESGFSKKFASNLLNDALCNLVTSYSPNAYSLLIEGASALSVDSKRLYKFYSDYNSAVSQQYLSSKLALLVKEDEYLRTNKMDKHQVDTLSLFNLNDFSAFEHILDEPDFNLPAISDQVLADHLRKIKQATPSDHETATHNHANSAQAEPMNKPNAGVSNAVNHGVHNLVQAQALEQARAANAGTQTEHSANASDSATSNEEHTNKELSKNSQRSSTLTARYVLNLIQPSLRYHDLVLSQVQIGHTINIPVIVCNPFFGILLVVCSSASEEVLTSPEQSHANYLALPTLLNLAKSQIANFLTTKLHLSIDSKRKILSCIHGLVIHENVPSIMESVKKCKALNRFDPFYVKFYHILKNAKQEQMYLVSLLPELSNKAKEALQLQVKGQRVDPSILGAVGSGQYIFETYQIQTPFKDLANFNELKEAILALGHGIYDQDIHQNLTFEKGQGVDYVQKSVKHKNTNLQINATKAPLAYTKLDSSQEYAYVPQFAEPSAVLDALKRQMQDHNQFLLNRIHTQTNHTLTLNHADIHTKVEQFKPHFWLLKQLPLEQRELIFLDFNQEHLNFIFDVRSCLLVSLSQSALNSQVLLEKVIYEYVRLKSQSLDLALDDPNANVSAQDFSVVKAQHKRLVDSQARAVSNLRLKQVEQANNLNPRAHIGGNAEANARAQAILGKGTKTESSLQEQIRTHSRSEQVKALICIRHMALYQSVLNYLQKHMALLDLKDFKIVPVDYLFSNKGKEDHLDDLSAIANYDLILIDGAEKLSAFQVEIIQKQSKAIGLYFGIDYHEDFHHQSNILSQVSQNGTSCLEHFYDQSSESGYDEHGRYLAQLWCSLLERNRHPDLISLPVLNTQAPVLELLRRNYLHHYFKDKLNILVTNSAQHKANNANLGTSGLKPLSPNPTIHNALNAHNNVRDLQVDNNQIGANSNKPERAYLSHAYEESALFGVYLKRKYVKPSVGAFNICTLKSNHLFEVIQESANLIKGSFNLDHCALLEQEVLPELNLKAMTNKPSWKQAYQLINDLQGLYQKQKLGKSLRALCNTEGETHHSSNVLTPKEQAIGLDRLDLMQANAVVSLSPAISVINDFTLRHSGSFIRTNSQFVSLERMFYQNLNNLSPELKMRLTPLRLRLSERIYLERCAKDYALEKYMSLCFGQGAGQYVQNMAHLICLQTLQSNTLSGELLDYIMNKQLNLEKLLSTFDPLAIKSKLLNLVYIKGRHRVGVLGTQDDGIDLKETLDQLLRNKCQELNKANAKLKHTLDELIDLFQSKSSISRGALSRSNQGILDYEHLQNQGFVNFIQGAKAVFEYAKTQSWEDNSDLNNLLMALDSLQDNFTEGETLVYNRHRNYILEQRLHMGIVGASRICATLNLSAGDSALSTLSKLEVLRTFLPWLHKKSDIHESFDLAKASHCAILELIASQNYMLKQNTNKCPLHIKKALNALTLQAMAPTVEERLCKLLAMAWLVQKEPTLESDFSLMLDAYLGKGEFTNLPSQEIKSLLDSLEDNASLNINMAKGNIPDSMAKIFKEKPKSMMKANQSHEQRSLTQFEKDSLKELALYQHQCSPQLEGHKISTCLKNLFADHSAYKKLITELSLDSHFNFAAQDFRLKGQSLRYFKVQKQALNFISLDHCQGLELDNSCVFLLEDGSVNKEALYLALQCAQSKLKLVLPGPKLQHILIPHYRNALMSLQHSVNASHGAQHQASNQPRKEWVTFSVNL